MHLKDINSIVHKFQLIANWVKYKKHLCLNKFKQEFIVAIT